MAPRRKTSEHRCEADGQREAAGFGRVKNHRVMRWDAAKSRRRLGARPVVQKDPAGRGTANESEARRR